MVGGLSIEGCLSTPALCDGGVHRRRLVAPKAPFFIPERGGIVNNRRRFDERITGRHAAAVGIEELYHEAHEGFAPAR